MKTMHKLIIVLTKHKTTTISSDLYLTKKLLNICYLFNIVENSSFTTLTWGRNISYTLFGNFLLKSYM